MVTTPPKWIAHTMMSLAEIPLVDFDTIKGTVRTDLLIVKQAGATRDPGELEKDWRSYPPDYLLPDSTYMEATADDVLWKWHDLQNKGDSKYDGVFRTEVETESGTLSMIHFWNLSTNDTCDYSHTAGVMFPITLTENEALWLMGAIGLNPLKEGCQTGNEMSDLFHYRFNIDLMQIDTYAHKLEAARDRDPNTLTDERYEEIHEALQNLKMSHFWEGTGIFVVGGVGAGVAMGGLGFALKGILQRLVKVGNPALFFLIDPRVIEKKMREKNQS